MTPWSASAERPPFPPAPRPQPGNGLATTSLVLGMIGLLGPLRVASACCSCSRCRSRSAPGSPATSAASRSADGLTKAGDGIAHAGIILGIVGVVVGVVGAVVWIILLSSGFDRRRVAAVRARVAAANLRRDLPTNPRVPRMTPNPYTKQYLMTAGPTPVPPAVSQAMAAPMLYHRAPAFDELYERVLGKLPVGLPTRRTTVLTFAASGSGAMESAVANLVRPGDKVARRRGRQVRRALDRARRGLRRRPRPLRARLGRAARSRRVSTGCWARTPDVEVVVRDAQRDLDRHRQRHPGDRRGGPQARRDPRGRRRLRPRRGRAPAGRVGRRRRRRRLAEGADEPARPRLRVGVPAGARATSSRAAGGRYYFDWGKTAKTQRKGTRPFTPAVSLFLGARRRARPDRGRGPGRRLRPPRPARPRHARRRRRARPRAVRRPGRALDGRDRDRAAGRHRRRQGPRRRCASSASPPTAARTTSRARSCASRTAATSARSTS